jgi:hypothetical protein
MLGLPSRLLHHLAFAPPQTSNEKEPDMKQWDVFMYPFSKEKQIKFSLAPGDTRLTPAYGRRIFEVC